MICLDCESVLDLTDREHCGNCGVVPERAQCGVCELEFGIDVFVLHLCGTVQNLDTTKPLATQGLDLASAEISPEDFELLRNYFELQDQNKLVNTARREKLDELFSKFGEQDLLTFQGRIVGKVVKSEYSGLDVELLKQKFPEVYRACLTKVKKQKYIKRASNLI